MPVRIALGVLGLMATCLCCPRLSWAQASPGSASPTGDARRDVLHTLFVELRQPFERSRPALQKLLKNEGYESFAEGEREVALVLTAWQIEALFGGRVQFHEVAASASRRTLTVPYLEDARIPARFRKLIRRVYFDPQRS